MKQVLINGGKRGEEKVVVVGLVFDVFFGHLKHTKSNQTNIWHMYQYSGNIDDTDDEVVYQ